jgi:hypothetical protein
VRAASDDLLVRILNIPEIEYEGIKVNSSWPQKGLVEGDIVLCARGETPGEGDIVLLEQHGLERLGLMGTPGFLETPRGNRPLEASENVVGVGVVLVRNLTRFSARSSQR